MGTRRKWIQENTWTCSYCSHTNLGRHNQCQSCNARKGSDSKEQIPAGNPAMQVTDPELLKIARGGADWTCEYCGSKTRNAKGECANCSGPKEEFVAPEFQEPKEVSPQPPQPPSHPKPTVEQAMRYVEWHRKGRDGPGFPSIVWACSVLFLLPMCLAFYSSEVTAQVSSVTWEYSISLEQEIENNKEDWAPLPGDAYAVSCQNKYYGEEDCHCRQVSDGYDTETYDCRPHDCFCHTSCSNMGNGFSSCEENCDTCYDSCSRQVQKFKEECDSCPVYRDYCHYKQKEWVRVSTRDTSGSLDEPHYDPSVVARGPQQRTSTTEKYSVKFKEDNKTYSYTPRNLSDYKRFQEGDRWKFTVGFFNGINTNSLERK